MRKTEARPDNMSDQQLDRIKQIVGWGIVGLIVVIGVSIVLSLNFAPRPPGPFFFPFQFGWLGAIFLIFILFWVAKWLIWPWRGGYYSYRYEHRNAESILKERYAKGEITKEQFEQMRRDLEHKS
jgi:putative membrane protein